MKEIHSTGCGIKMAIASAEDEAIAW
jgi:hypothetical protein